MNKKIQIKTPCSWCNKIAHRKTAAGNWYCNSCWEKGWEEEKEAMGYGKE